MADFSGTTTVNASEKALFDFLSDVGNPPRYFARMTSAESGEGNEVHTTAMLDDGITRTLTSIKLLVEEQNAA